MSGQTCHRCHEHYDTHDSHEHRCPDQRELDDAYAHHEETAETMAAQIEAVRIGLQEQIDALGARVVTLERWKRRTIVQRAAK